MDTKHTVGLLLQGHPRRTPRNLWKQPYIHFWLSTNVTLHHPLVSCEALPKGSTYHHSAYSQTKSKGIGHRDYFKAQLSSQSAHTIPLYKGTRLYGCRFLSPKQGIKKKKHVMSLQVQPSWTLWVRLRIRVANRLATPALASELPVLSSTYGFG